MCFFRLRIRSCPAEKRTASSGEIPAAIFTGLRTEMVTMNQQTKERVKLLAYAFEQAAKKGEPRNWNYIDGVMRKLARRGIDTVEKADDYDYEREARA